MTCGAILSLDWLDAHATAVESAAAPPTPSPEDVERLRALGYVR